MDAAFRNANEMRERLAQRAAELRAELTDVTAELKNVEAFLVQWASFAGVPVPAGVAPVAAEKPHSRPRPNNTPKEVVGDHVERLLREANRPMSRNALFQALQNEGEVTIDGTAPEMVLSTMLWRMRERFRRIRGEGYYLVGEPYDGEDTALEFDPIPDPEAVARAREAD